MDSHICLAGKELIKFVKSMNDGKSFFLNLCVALFSWRKRAITVRHWFPVNAVRVGGVCSRLENSAPRPYSEAAKWSITGVFTSK